MTNETMPPWAASYLVRRLVLLSILLATAGCVASDDPTPVPGDEITTAEATEPAPTPTPDTPAAESAPATNSSQTDAESTNASEPAPPAMTVPPPAAEPRIMTLRWEGSVTGVRPAPLAVPDSDACCHPGYEVEGGGTAATFAVSDTPRAILVELVWDDAMYDLDITLTTPDREARVPPAVNGTTLDWGSGRSWTNSEQSPEGRAALLIDDTDALATSGDWRWGVSVKAGKDVAFRVVVTVFQDAAPPEGYTAVGA